MVKWINKKVKYSVTGFVGKCTAVTFYATGRTMLLLEGNDSTGRPIEWWIEEQFAEIVA